MQGYLESEYIKESKDYETRCQRLASIVNDLQKDMVVYKDKIESMRNYNDSFSQRREAESNRFFQKISSRVKTSLRKLDRKPIEAVIKDDMTILGELRNALYGKITIAENEIQTAEEKIQRLYKLEEDGIRRIKEDREMLKKAEEELIDLERISETIEVKNLSDREEKIRYQQKIRMKKNEIGKYESRVISNETALNQIRNLREAYEILVDEGISLALKNARTTYNHINETHNALKNITSGKIALSGLVKTTSIALAGLVNIREDMNYVFDIIVGTASKLSEAIPVLKEPFYDRKMLEHNSAELKEADREIKRALKDSIENDDVIDILYDD